MARSGPDLRLRLGEQVKAIGSEQVLSDPRSPWQRAYVERTMGSIRREAWIAVVLGERSLHHTLTAYCACYKYPSYCPRMDRKFEP